MVTVNNWTEADSQCFADCGAQYYVYGDEVGDEGTPHLQGYVYFKSQRTMASLKKKFPRAHLDKRKGSHEQAVDYCKKDGRFVEFGDPPEKNGGNRKEKIKRNHMLMTKPLIELVNDGDISVGYVPTVKKARIILAQEGDAITTEECKGLWIHGPPSTGKTHYVMSTHENVYMKAQNKWWDGYQGEEVVLLDDFDCKMLGHYLKRWMDKWKCFGEIKGGTVALRHTKFIITSNYLPSAIWNEDPVLADAISSRCVFKHMLVKHKRSNANE